MVGRFSSFKTISSTVRAFSVAALLSLTAGCSLSPTAPLSGSLPVQGTLTLRGGVMGGQQPVYNATIGLYAAGTTGTYGTGSTNLISNSVSASSCVSSSAITAFSITSNVVTFTVNNTLGAGSLVRISGLSAGTYLNGQTLTVLSSTATSFTASFTHADVPTTVDNGSATQSCTTTATGSFNITADYACPSASTPVYLTATGGDPTGNASATNNNTAIQLVAALGPCGNLSSSTFIQVNEVTTVAAAFGLGQFYGGFGGTDAIGAPASNVNGLTDAFATAHNLASTTTGVTTGTTAASGTNYFLIQYDQEKLNTIANILSACVNQTSASGTNTNGGTTTTTPLCTTLFNDVTPNGGTAPTNVFQAAVYMSLNPTSNTAASGSASNSSTNLAALYNLQSPFEPFTPALTASAAPTDWTLAIQYSGTGVNYLSSAAVDANGDLWFSNTNTTGGVVQLNGGTGNAGGTAGVAGGDIAFVTGAGALVANGTRQVAIDQYGLAWFGGYTTADLFRTTGGTSPTNYSYATTGATPYAIAVDGNDVVVASTGNGNVIEIPAQSATAAGGITNTATIEATGGAAGLAITSGTTPIAYAPAKGGTTVAEFTTNATVTTNTDTPAVVTASNPYADGGSNNYGAAVDANNKVWIVNQSATGTLTTVTGSGASNAFAQVSNSCLQTPQFVAIDGSDNVWVSNSTGITANVNGTSTTITTVCEFNNAGTLISSTPGYGPHGISTGRGIAVDLSGNVWVTSYGTTYSSVTEIVGVATPAVAPLSVALKNGTIGKRP